ncbi:branched-chain amino acid ABC transporter permease [Ottowia testudinis]|uniref:Branched-chain amino acid ABC transporter permease n=1 Tax=Ottowia testudinis TaxID=2816950 RepID=A0A975CHP2_9BURK|nr:branched-chain amino acid ABC transporter permease [Ottowia testudinis]QTD46011.1 branched-chain amino acid ABC transporter permease [Ottowia testudinis]
MAELLQYLFDALSLGSLYALAALGIALIFGVMRLVNFAYGDVISFCAFALIVPTTEAVSRMMLGALPTPLLIVSVLAVGAGLSIALEWLVFRRLRHANPATTMVAAFAVGFVILNVLLALHSSRPKSVDLWSPLNTPLNLLGARVPALQLVTIGIAGALLVGLVWMLRRTRVGLEMRAAAEDFSMARMLGVRANRVILVAFGLSGALAATVGLLMITKTGVADIRMGGPMMLIAFVATVIGGLGSLSGAVLAGFLMGFISTLLQALLPMEARPFRDAFLYLAVIALLVVRPAGLFVTRASTQRV